MKKNLFIFGCSGIAKSICDTLERLPPKYNEITLVDSNYSLHTNNFYGYKVIKEEDLKHNISNGADVIFAFFKPSDIFNRNNYINDILHDYKLNLVSIIDPLAVISKSSEIGNGSYIASNVFVDSDVSIGRNCIILFNSVISREIKITDNTFISAGCVLKGSIAINESSFISANVSLANNIQKNSFINVGVVMTEEVLEPSIIGLEKNIKKLKLPDNQKIAQKRLRFLHP